MHTCTTHVLDLPKSSQYYVHMCKQAFSYIVDALNKLSKCQKLLSGISDSLSASNLDHLEPILPYITNMLEPILPYITNMLEPILPYITNMLEPILPYNTNMLEPILPYITNMLEPILPYITNMLEPILPYITNMLENTHHAILSELSGNSVGKKLALFEPSYTVGPGQKLQRQLQPFYRTTKKCGRKRQNILK